MEIQKLTLFTSKLKAQKKFYAQVMGFPILQQGRSSVSFIIGASTLRFESKEKSTPYHFAFTIPSNQELEALDWLRERVEILKFHVDEIVDFKNWNAKSIYFYDPDKNIVEFIARKNLSFESEKPFGSASMVEISEIGVPVDDIEDLYHELKKNRLEIYDGNFDKFCAIGDERGLFITINKNKKKWFPTDDRAFSSPFKINIKINGSFKMFEFENGEINSNI